MGIFFRTREIGAQICSMTTDDDTDSVLTCCSGPWTALSIFKFRGSDIASWYHMIAKSRRYSFGKLLSSSLQSPHIGSLISPDVATKVCGLQRQIREKFHQTRGPDRRAHPCACPRSISGAVRHRQ